jgi:hypothetical protein
MSGAWVAAAAVVGAAGSYLSAKKGQQVAKNAAKPKETYQVHTPYMNDYISKISPYILSEAQRMYSSRLGAYSGIQGGKGYKPGDFSPIAAMLAGIPTGYSGVGKPGDPIMNGSSGGGGASSYYGSNGNPYSSDYGAPSRALARQDPNSMGRWMDNSAPAPYTPPVPQRPAPGSFQPPDESVNGLVNYWDQ